MRLLKPAWVHHDGKAIFSVDIHPDGSRFATGGQGEDCGKVVIWNMAPVRDDHDEKDDSVPKILCQMDNHLACVNCVRWSCSGKFLASAGDDKLIMIWQTSRYAGASGVFGSGSKNVEQWRVASTLRGHTGDVLDLAWSANDAWLASCSVDNTVIVWNAEKFPEQVAVLRGHQGLVKGVTWDPVGKYLASQSDDKSVRVWRTLDWQVEATVTEPFQECGGTTHVLRLDWSPDGSYVVSAHAMNNSGPTAQIIEREGWKATLDFVGHRKAVTVVRFNPNILSKKINMIKKSSEKPQQYTCCAIGSRDRSLSIWLTALKRPLVVTHDLFQNSILDISWSKNGMELICGSVDGTVAFIDFTQEEIGIALSQDEMQSLLEKIYGKCLARHSTANTSDQIIESTAMLNLQQKQKVEKMEVTHGDPGTPSKLQMNGSDSPYKPNKQIETKTVDGRRRITPIFLAPQPDVSVGEAPLPFSSKNIQFTSSSIKSQIVVEKQDKVTGPGLLSSPSSRSHSMSSPQAADSGSTPKPAGSESTVKPAAGDSVVRSAASDSVVRSTAGDSVVRSAAGDSVVRSAAGDSVVRSASGDVTSKAHSAESVAMSPAATESEKKASSVSSVIQPMTALEGKSQDEQTDKAEKPKSLLGTPDRTQEKDKHKEKSKLGSLVLKRKHEGGHGKVGRPRKIDKELQQKVAVASTAVGQPPALRETTQHIQTVTDLQLPVPDIQKSYSRQVAGKEGTDTSILVEIENGIQVGTLTLNKIKCSHDGWVAWEHIFPSKVTNVAGSSYLVCVSCEDNSLSILSAGGRKLFPNLVLNSRASILEANGHYVMIITQKGSVYLWNTQSRIAVMNNESLSGIMSGRDKILRSSVTVSGVIVLSLSSNKSYTYSSELCCWVLVHTVGDPLRQCSDHRGFMPNKQSLKGTGPLSSLQSSENKIGMNASRMFQSGQNMQQTTTLSYLETQVASCLYLKSASEYKFWLVTYVRYLAQEGLESKLREVCDDLLGPVYRSNSSSAWQEWILDMNKRELLQEILPIMGSNLRLQRLYTEYQEQLESVKS